MKLATIKQFLKTVLKLKMEVEYIGSQELILFAKSAVSRNTKIEVDNRSEFLAFDHVSIG